MLANLFSGLVRALRLLGCLLTLAAGALFCLAVFAMDHPGAREGRGLVFLLAMACALFGVPLLLASRSGTGQ